MLMAVVRFKFSAVSDLLCNIVATYFNFSRLVKLCQKLVNLCHFVNVQCSRWKGLFFKPKIGKNIWLFTFQYHFCFHLFSMLWGSASRFFRGEASHFCCSWVVFMCVACPTHNFLSFTSLVWVQAVVEITSCLAGADPGEGLRGLQPPLWAAF